MLEEVHIACSIDRNYVQHIGVTLTSLFENNVNCQFNIHLFSSEFKQSELESIQNICSSSGHIFKYYYLDPSLFEGFFLSNHITVASYYRIFIPQVLERSIEKIIYLDADLIIKRDILELWNTDMKGRMMGGIPDPNQDNVNNTRLNIPLIHKYINAGVLLLNVKKWKEDNLTEKLTGYILSNYSIIYFHDQDTLNKILHDDSFTLPVKWNLQTAVFDLPRKKLIEVYGEKELNEALKDPCIIHYTGTSKPWDYLNLHPLRAAYFKYLKLTEWKDYKYTGVTFSKRIQKLLMRIIGIQNFQKMVSWMR